MHRRLVCSLFLVCASQAVLGQNTSHGVSVYDQPGSNRTFALVRGTAVMLNGGFWQEDHVSNYAHTHPGQYIVFEDGPQLRRIDDPKRLEEAEAAYAPLIPLEAREKELAEQQKPFAQQQRVLADQQRAARGNPTEQARIGQEQGRVGQQQGALGQKQGEIGRQQGVLGVAFYNKVQGMLKACLADGSCPVVANETAQR